MSSVPYFPFTGEPYKMLMGVKPLDLAFWIERDEFFKPCLAKKEKLLKEKRDIVLGHIKGPGQERAYEGCFDLYEELQSHLLKTFPNNYKMEDGEFVVCDTQRRFPKAKNIEQTLEHMALWAQEDFCLLSPKGPVQFEAACVCFPSRWKLSDKIGRDSNAIHGPVPKFKEAIGKPTESFLEKIQVDKPMWRINWTIHDCDETFTPVAEESHKKLTVENVLQETYIRLERQTLRRLPRSGYVVFTIRTYIVPIALIAQDPEKRLVLKKSLEVTPQETLHYKGMRNFSAQLIAAL